MKKHMMKKRKNRFWLRIMIAFLAIGIGLTLCSAAQSNSSLAASGNVQANIIKITPGTSSSVLVGRPDTDLIELPSGRKMQVGDLRQLSQISQELRSMPSKKISASALFKIKPKQKGFVVKNSSDLATALKRPENETIELPSGRRATVAQIKFLEPYIEKRLGHKLTQTRRTDLTQNPIKVSSAADKTFWKSILKKPDNTVLEAPDGTRITVGELKQTLAADKTARSISSSPAMNHKQ